MTKKGILICKGVEKVQVIFIPKCKAGNMYNEKLFPCVPNKKLTKGKGQRVLNG